MPQMSPRATYCYPDHLELSVGGIPRSPTSKRPQLALNQLTPHFGRNWPLRIEMAKMLQRIQERWGGFIDVSDAEPFQFFEFGHMY